MNLAGARELSPPNAVQTGPGAQTASYTKDTGVKQPEPEADHSVRLILYGVIPPLANTSSWHCASLSTRTNLNFHLFA